MVECGHVQRSSQHHVKPLLRAFDADALTLHEHLRFQHHPLLALVAANALLQLHLYILAVARHIAFQLASDVLRRHRSEQLPQAQGATVYCPVVTLEQTHVHVLECVRQTHV